MVLSVAFPGFGLYYESPFITDLSETCKWISPFVLPTEDLFDIA
jgi:hypothetical protein